MKHTIRDSFIWLLTVVGITAIYRAQKRKTGPLVRVLCFHDVPDERWFENVISMCAKKYNVLTPEAFHSKTYDTDTIHILLTFDDGYQSWIDTCLPVLEKYNYKGLFFINSGLLAAAENKTETDTYMQENLRIVPRRALTWAGAEKLIAQGHSIGGHTVGHADLTHLSPERTLQEIKSDKIEIESRLAVAICDFAYPFGTSKHYNEDVTKQVQGAGYEHAYSAETGFYVPDIADTIPRTLVENNQPLRSLQRWIGGGYDIFSTLKI